MTREDAITGLLRGEVLTIKTKGEYPLTTSVGRYPGLVKGRPVFYAAFNSGAWYPKCIRITRAQALAFIQRNFNA